jgi:flagellar basal body rod protein FlgG
MLPPGKVYNAVLAAQPGGLAAQQAGGAPAGDAARFINLRDRGKHLTITAAGEIYSGEDLVARLSVVEFQDRDKLRKAGGSLFESPDPAVVPGGAKRTVVRQGVLETSNVNPVEEMTNLIKANRLFEHDMKALKTYGELMGREANDIGKL